MKYVKFIRGRYVLRMTVPPALREIVGKRELVRPLGGDKKVAERQARGVIAGFQAVLGEAQETYAANRPTLFAVAKEHCRSELGEDERSRLDIGQETVVGLNSETLATMATYERLIDSNWSANPQKNGLAD